MPDVTFTCLAGAQVMLLKTLAKDNFMRFEVTPLVRG